MSRQPRTRKRLLCAAAVVVLLATTVLGGGPAVAVTFACSGHCYAGIQMLEIPDGDSGFNGTYAHINMYCLSQSEYPGANTFVDWEVWDLLGNDKLHSGWIEAGIANGYGSPGAATPYFFWGYGDWYTNTVAESDLFQYTPEFNTSYLDSIWNYADGGDYIIQIGDNTAYGTGFNERSLGAQAGTETTVNSTAHIDVYGVMGSLSYYTNEAGSLYTGWNNPESGDSGWHVPLGPPQYGYASWITTNQSAYIGSQSGGC